MADWNRQFGELKPYTPSPTERVKGMLHNFLIDAGMGKHPAGVLANATETAAQFFPPYSIPAAAADYNYYNQRNMPVESAISVLGLAPGGKPLAKLARGKPYIGGYHGTGVPHIFEQAEGFKDMGKDLGVNITRNPSLASEFAVHPPMLSGRQGDDIAARVIPVLAPPGKYARVPEDPGGVWGNEHIREAIEPWVGTPSGPQKDFVKILDDRLKREEGIDPGLLADMKQKAGYEGIVYRHLNDSKKFDTFIVPPESVTLAMSPKGRKIAEEHGVNWPGSNVFKEQRETYDRQYGPKGLSLISTPLKDYFSSGKFDPRGEMVKQLNDIVEGWDSFIGPKKVNQYGDLINRGGHWYTGQGIPMHPPMKEYFPLKGMPGDIVESNKLSVLGQLNYMAKKQDMEEAIARYTKGKKPDSGITFVKVGDEWRSVHSGHVAQEEAMKVIDASGKKGIVTINDYTKAMTKLQKQAKP